jgi:hypothetical protein
LEYAGYLLSLNKPDDKIIHAIKIGSGFMEDEIVVGLVLSVCGWTYKLRGYDILGDVVNAATTLVDAALNKWSENLPSYTCSLPFEIFERNLMELAKQVEPVVEESQGGPLCLSTTAVVGEEFTLSFIKFGIDKNVEWLIMDMPGNFSNFIEICMEASMEANEADQSINFPTPWPSDTCTLYTSDNDDDAYMRGTINEWIKNSSADTWYRYLGKSYIHPHGDRRGERLRICIMAKNCLSLI